MDFSPYAEDFVAHYDSVRGQVRLRLLEEQVAAQLPTAARVLDVGGGAGHLAARLAVRGHQVVVLEPSAAMRARAGEVLAGTAGSVSVEAGDAASVPSRPDAGSFDAVLCHAVSPYVDDLTVLVGDVVAAVGDGGLVSLVVKNRGALAMRPALEGRWADVPAAVDADGDAGGLGVRNRAHHLDEAVDALAAHRCVLEAWYGVRVVSDVLRHDVEADVALVLEAERALTGRDPYRALGRLLHVVARRGDPAVRPGSSRGQAPSTS